MKKKKLLIIGRNGLIASHIFKFMKKKKTLLQKELVLVI